MAKTVIKAASIFYGYTDLSGNLNMVGLDISAPEVDVTNLAGNGWNEVLQGIRAGDLSLTGFLEAVTSTSEPEKLLADNITADGTVLCTVDPVRPSVDGDVCFFANLIETQLTEKVRVGEAWGFDAKLKATTPVIRGAVLETVTRTATGTSAAYLTLPAVGATERLYWGVHVLRTVAGTSPTLDLLIQSDDATNFPSATTRVTVTQFTTHGSAFGYVAGAITDTYYRISATVGGTGGPSFPYVVVLGVAT